jgi:hypothetical protein
VQETDWRKFEELAAGIQGDLAPDAVVKKNVKLLGRSGTQRQIDILIEQDTGQFQLRVVIDCKNYKNPVDIKDVEMFLGLVEDVGAHKGAIVAANGFTEAAKQRAAGAGLDLFRLVDTSNHKWRSYFSIPAVLYDYEITSFSFKLNWTGYGEIDLRKDLRYLPLLREDGALIDYAVNLVCDRWEDGKIPKSAGEYRDIQLTSERTFLDSPKGRFEATIKANVTVAENIYFGQLDIVQARGFKSELNDVTHLAKSLRTAPIIPAKIAKEWQKIASVDELAVKPVFTLKVQSAYPRYRPAD